MLPREEAIFGDSYRPTVKYRMVNILHAIDILSDVTSHPANDRVLCFDEQGVSVTLCAGTSAGFWLGGQCPLAARGEENFENLTTKWCILKYI